MKKHHINVKMLVSRIVSLLLCVCIALTASVAADEGIFLISAESDSDAAAAAYQKKLKEAREQKEKYEKQKAEQEALIAEFTQQKEDIETYISELDLQMNDISLRIFELQTEIGETEKELEATKKALEEAKNQEAEQYDTMKKRIAYMYENGDSSYLDVLLNSKNVSDFLNQLEYVQSIVKYDNALLDRYKTAKENTILHEGILEASLEELELMRSNAELEQDTVEDLMALKAAEIDKLTTQLGIADEDLFNSLSAISKQEKAIEQIMEDEQKRLEEEERKRKEEEERRRKEEEERRRKAEEERKRLEEEGKINKPKSTSGYDADAINHVELSDETNPYKMIWPLPGDYRTYSRFGPRKAPTAGASTYHKGWDIGGEFGAPIVAVLAGKVVAATYNSSGGNYVKIEHEPGFMTTYCHCSKFLVSEGDYVMQGQQIALVGSTGVSTGPHLHFAVDSDGVKIDPAPYIAHFVD